MRAGFIFGNKLSLEENKLFDNSHITYFVCDLLNKKLLTRNDIISALSEHLDVKINIGLFHSYLTSTFVERDGLYSINELQKVALEKVSKYETELFVLKWDQETEIFEKIGEFIKYNRFDVEKAFYYSIATDKIRNHKDTELSLGIFFDLIINKDKYFRMLDEAIDNIDSFYNNLSMKVVFENKVVLDLCFANGVYNIVDLKDLSLESVFTLFSIDIEACIKLISQLGENSKLSFKEDLKAAFTELTVRELDVLSKRNGFDFEPLTLDETGQIYGLTRERCRQIEVKATSKILKKSQRFRNQLLTLFIVLTVPEERRYISIETFNEYMGSELLTKYYLFVIENGFYDLKFSSELKIVYNSTLVSTEELFNEVIGVYGPYIFKSDYEVLNQFEKSVIDNYYREYYKDFYLLKGYSTKELIGLMIDEVFPEGYKIGDATDYNLLSTCFKEKYNTDDMPLDRSIVGFLDRLNYCQIGKGKYKNRQLCPQLPQEMLDSMINYILLNKPTVYYQSIFEEFKTQLIEMGIDNYFYLKGLLDQYLPEDFKTKRNYIICGNEIITGYEAMLQYIHTFNGKFSINELREKYPGVKDYTFYNLLINESGNGLIWLANKNLIYIDKVVISEDSIKQLKKFIDDLFVQLETETTSSRKIYARLSLTNKSLLESLKIATDNFSIFSLIKYWFKDEYGFNRPLVSKSKDINVSTYSLITNYVNSLDSFNAKGVHNYCSKMNIGGLYSYLSFMEDMSDNFVQANIDTMYKKEKMAISNSHLNDFKGMMELIFSRFDFINTRQFNGYQMLPNVPYHWNKYLLVGIIRSYFSDEYVVENTETSYDLTDFIIRRSK